MKKITPRTLVTIGISLASLAILSLLLEIWTGHATIPGEPTPFFVRFGVTCMLAAAVPFILAIVMDTKRNK